MSTRPERTARDPVLLGCIAAVLAPFLVGLVRVAFVRWTPVGDWALLELHTRSVGGSHTPLVGVYSRFGWSHPGPGLFYVLAIPYRLLGSEGLLVGALLVNAASVAGIVWLAWRRGGRPLAVGTAIAVIVLCRALGADFLRDPWNPFITVLPLALLVFLAWSIACGDAWMLPIAVVVGSFIVQSHVGYAALVVVALGGAIAWWVVALVRSRSLRARPRPRRAAAVLGVTTIVALAAWLPSLADQVRYGNLRAISDFFGEPHQTPSVDTATRVVGRALTLPGAWVTGHESVRTSDFTAASAGFFVPAALAALLAAIVVAVRRRDGDTLALLALVVALLATGVYSISHIAGPLAAYLVRWVVVLGMLTWLAAVWTFWPAVRNLGIGSSARSVLLVVVIALVVVPTAMNVDDAVRDRGPWYRPGLVERGLARDTISRLGHDGRPVLLESKDERWYTWGLAPRLEAAGIPVAAKPYDVLFYGRHRVSRQGEARRAVFVVTGAGARTTRRPPGGRLLAWYPGVRPEGRGLPASADYGAVVRAAESDLLALPVAVYEVPLAPG